MEHEAVRELAAAYALDALDPEDERAFEAHLSRCPECREELASFQEVAAGLAHDVEAPPPSPALRRRILDEAPKERPMVVPLGRPWAFRAVAGLAAAAASAAIGLGIWAASLAGEREAGDGRARVVELAGAEGTLIIAPSGDAALFVSGLEPAPAGRTYEAWVIEDDRPLPAGLFDSAGERTVVPLTRPVPKGATVAVTLELAGGVESPTGAPLFSAQAA